MTRLPRSRLPDIVPLTGVLSALSFALDVTEGQPMGHALRACLISMELADRLDLPLAIRRDLYYAALLKDAGCSSNAAHVFEMFGSDDRTAKRDRMRVDWSSDLRAALYALAHAAPDASWLERARRIAALARRGPKSAAKLVKVRCERGAEIVLELGLGPGVAAVVRALDEHWDGHGQPGGLRGESIPVAARVLGLAQTLDVFAADSGSETALDVARRRSGRWFDPNVVAACRGLEPLLERWSSLGTPGLRDAVAEAEPGAASLLAGSAKVRRIAHVFAGIVDAKSPFTGAHSHRMAEIAVAVAGTLGWSAADLEETRCAALLHDLGKLSVPNSILDKPGSLSVAEWEVMRMHALYTERILEHVQGFEWLAFASASHHERLNGHGYCRGLEGESIPELSRVLAVADVFDALSTPRPYRGALAPDEVFAIMERDRDGGFCPECLDALGEVIHRGDAEEERRAA